MKIRNGIYFVVFVCLLSFQVSAQTPKPTAAPQTNDEGDVVKITTSLVQLDAVVTDKDGNPVTNLSAKDFEVYQDGKLQKLSNFSFIDTTIKGGESKIDRNTKKDKNKTIPPVRKRPNSTGRVITFVVDDGNCAASSDGMSKTRQALTKFVREVMQPNDLLSIYRTRSGSSLMRQYTSDRAQLLRVVKKVRWRPLLGCSSSGDSFEVERQWDSIKLRNDPMIDGVTDEQRNQELKDAQRADRRDSQVIGALGVIRYIVKGLERVPGRKLMFLMSDGIALTDETGTSTRTRTLIRKLTDEANRASVVINTIDVRGVSNPGFISAADDVRADLAFGSENNRITAVSERRIRESRWLQGGLRHVAEATGGNFYQGNNNLIVSLRKAMNLEKGYYLLGYEPDDETFKGLNFHSIQIKLKRPELRVFSRAGFIGRETKKRKIRKGDSALYDAIAAPLPEAGLGMRLTAFFGNSKDKGDFVRSLIHVEGKDINFVDAESGRKKAVFDVIAVTLNKKNEVVDEFNRTHTVQIDARAVPLIKQNGLVYTTDVRVKKSGAYNFRVAIRDKNGGIIGSASEQITVPKLKANKMFASGLTISGVNQSGKFAAPASAPIEKAISLVNTKGIPAIRSFEQGKMLGYSYKVYRAKLDRTSKQPKLGQIVTIYKDGEVLTKGDPEVIKLLPQNDWSRTNVLGYMRLPENVEPGDYSVQIVVRDLLTKKTSTQWIDFEVVN